MKNKKIQKKFLISLILLMLFLSTVVMTGLINIIQDWGYKHFSYLAQMGIHLLYERLDSTLLSEVRQLRTSLDKSARIYALDSYFHEYRQTGKLPVKDLGELIQPGSSTFPLLPDVRYKADKSITLLTESGLIIASTDSIYRGTVLAPGSDVNKRNLSDFLQRSDEKVFTILENDSNRWFNLYIIYQLNHLFPESTVEKGFLAVLVKNLNIGKFLDIKPEASAQTHIYSYNKQGEITFSYPSLPESTGSTKQKQERIKLTGNLTDPIRISRPFKHETGVTVIDGSIWLHSLNIGMILELPAKNVLSPWYLLTALILIIIFISFLVFFIITILLEKRRIQAYDHNPLTHLPGNRQIMNRLKQALNSEKDLMVIYCDLDNFKAYNDLYGFSAGDDIIIFSAELLQKHFVPQKELFLGHIGGDDFIVIGQKESLKSSAEEFGADFDRKILSYYSREDREKGFIESQNRMGEIQKFPFISMSMGAVVIQNHPGTHPVRITEICAEVKKQAKKVKGSTLVIDARKEGEQPP